MSTKRQIATLSLIVLGVFSTIKAQETNEILKAPVVKKGNAGDAAVASNDNRLAIHVTGRKDGNMPTQKYATMLANAFADRKYTDKPMYITVIYSEKDQKGETYATIYMDGGRYKTKEGYNVFTPEQIGAAIKTITHIHVVRHGNKYVLKNKETVPTITLN